jgi:OFA family oxalate/formate antiporter-like MFS transporter
MSDFATVARLRPGAALAAATVLSLPLGSIYAFSVFLEPLEHLLSASRSELASVFGISVIFFTIGLNLAPWLFGVIPVPAIVALSAIMAAGGVAVAAGADGFPQLAFGYGVLFALGGGLAYVGAQQCVNATPINRPGLVNGYLVSLFPLGAMLSTPAFGWGIDAYGVRATLAGLAVAVAVSGAVATLLMAYSGVRLSRPNRFAGAETSAEDARRRSVVFWKLFLVFSFAATSGLMVLSQAAAILTAYGTSKVTALAATTGITAAIAAARLCGGLMVDRLPVPYVAAIAQLIALAGAVLLTLVPTPAMAIPTLGMIGIGYGLISGVTAAGVAFYWPKALFGQTASRIYIAWCLAALALPVAAARLFDMTGGYQTAIILAGFANLCGVVVGFSLPRQKSNSPVTPS